MENRRVHIRTAVIQDAGALLEIYAPYVENTAITFEYEVPSIQEFENRIRQIQKKYPYLAAELDGELVGYAYADVFHERAAYDWAVETSIYVKQDRKGMGIGGKLYKALEGALAAQGILNLNACIACPQKEDAYLTKDSIAFHEHLGYRLVGEFYECGYKFNRWYNMVWMEKHIGVHTNHQPAVKTFQEIRDNVSD